MKRLALLLALVFGTSVGAAQAAHRSHSETAKLKPLTVRAEVVKADPEARTLTVKVNGEEMTHPVHGKAVSRLKSLKPGENVTVTIMENEKGEHQYVRAIKVGKRTASKGTASKGTAAHHASRKY